MHFGVVLEGIGIGININIEISRKKEGKKIGGWIQKNEWKYKVQEQAVFQYRAAQISKLDGTQTKYPALKLTISKNIPAERWRFIET